MNYNVPYAEVDSTGRIISWGDMSPHSFLHQINPNYVFAPGFISPELQYVENGVMKERPIMELQRNGLHFIGLPRPCNILVNGKTYNVEDGEIELEFPQNGSYSITFQAWPYRDTVIEVSA